MVEQQSKFIIDQILAGGCTEDLTSLAASQPESKPQVASSSKSSPSESNQEKGDTETCDSNGDDEPPAKVQKQ